MSPMPSILARRTLLRRPPFAAGALAAAVAVVLDPGARAQANFAELGGRGLPQESLEAQALVLGDVDGDGDLDLLVGGGYGVGAVRLHANDGAGVFTAARFPSLPVDVVTSLVLGDLDGDGDLDLVVGCYQMGLPGQPNLLLSNDGAGRFHDATQAQLPASYDNTRALALGDVDGDGDLDLITGNRGWVGVGQQNRLHLNDGTGTFTDATAGRMPVDVDKTSSVALGDVDGDGDLDLVIGNSWQQNRLYLNDGTGSFTDATAARMPMDSDDTTSVALGDVDGDGDLDLVIGNGSYPAGAQDRLYLNDGTGVFTDATATGMPVDLGDTTSLVLGDVDGDRDLDLLVGHLRGRNRLYANDGAGRFSDVTASRLPADVDWTASLSLGDVDGDGDPDLVVGNVNRAANRLYLNLQRQLAAPLRPRTGQDYRLDVYARYGPARLVDVALPYIASATAYIPLPPFGTLRLDPGQLVTLPPVVVPQPSGSASLTIAVPNLPSLAGIAIHTQALLVQSPTQNLLTNLCSDRIVR